MIFTSADAVNWTQSTNNPSSASMYDSIWTGSEYIVVGDQEILHSVDGLTWSSMSYGISSGGLAIESIAWNGSLYVAVGWQALGHARLLTSSDGVTWTEPALGTIYYSHLNSVVWNGTQFVAVGNSGLILSSPDGTNWTQQTSGTTMSLTDVRWLGGQFIATGGTMDLTMLTSPDGVVWNSVSIPNPIGNVAWNGQIYLAAGNGNLGGMYTSSDAVTWTQTNWSYFAMYDIAWNGKLFVAVGKNGDIQTSEDGILWATAANGLDSINTNTLVLERVIWTGTQFIAVGGISSISGYPGVVVTSPDGVSWTPQAANADGKFYDVLWNGQQALIVGENWPYGLVIHSLSVTGNQPPAPTIAALNTVFGSVGTGQISANDPDAADTHTYSLLLPPMHGTATVDIYSGAITYLYGAGWCV